MGATFQTIATPDPNESSFQLTIDDRDLKPSDMPVKDTPYSAWTWGQKDRINEGWETYTYSHSTQGQGGKRVFVFVKTRTLAESLIPFDTYYTTKQYRWPMVLHHLGIIEAQDSGGTADASVGYIDVITPATEAVCDVKVELFLSNVPFSKTVLHHRQLITNDISIAHKGYPATYRDCLHPEIRFLQSYSARGDLQYDYGTQAASRVFETGDLTLPATSFTDWAPHVISDKQEPSNGLYLREKQTIFPPRIRPPLASQ